MMAHPWQHSAACRDEDPELFAPISYDGPVEQQIADAKAVCARCPVAAECLADAGADQDTIRGGLTPAERREQRRPHLNPARGSVRDLGRVMARVSATPRK